MRSPVPERAEPSQALWRTTQGTLSEIRGAGDNETRSAVTTVGDAIVNERLTRIDALAFTPNDSNSDVLVTQLTVPGLPGVLGTASAGVVTEEFSAVLRSNNSSEAPLRVVLEEQNPGLNRGPISLDLGEAFSAGTGIDDALTVIYGGGDTYYVFVDYDTVAAGVFDGSDTAFEDGDETAVNSTVQDTRLLLESQPVTVSSDGTFAATFNLSAQVPGDEFEVRITQAPFSATSEGVIVEENRTEASAVDVSAVL